jgi:hypothetical protein
VFPSYEVYTFGDSSNISFEQAYKEGGAGTYVKREETVGRRKIWTWVKQ